MLKRSSYEQMCKPRGVNKVVSGSHYIHLHTKKVRSLTGLAMQNACGGSCEDLVDSSYPGTLTICLLEPSGKRGYRSSLVNANERKK